MDTTYVQLAADIAVGNRPSGGPYLIKINDGQRFLTETEYTISISLESFEENNEFKENGVIKPSESSRCDTE